MTRTLVHPIYRNRISGSALCNLHGYRTSPPTSVEGVAPAKEILGASGSYGELPPVW
jgi:hypothetical protein